MELKDPIHGTIEISDAESAVLESSEFQRLRAIKQLGFAEFSFPGATHNRFLHSVGVMHLAGRAFDAVFRGFDFQSAEQRSRLRQTVRLGALLHDIGHGPLSHTTESVMPAVGDLEIEVYRQRDPKHPVDPERQATHEDYTIKMLTQSDLTSILVEELPEIPPEMIVGLIDRHVLVDDQFFQVDGVSLRPVLSQLVSSEMDVDRMDYLERDAYFCGTNYGRVEIEWLIANLTLHVRDSQAYLALNRRALYTFDDFLISRHHMYLMIYFHHKSIIYEEMLARYLESSECTYRLPADLNSYIKCTDFSLYEHLSSVQNPWARRIAERRPFRMLIELHSTEQSGRALRMQQHLEQAGVQTIETSSRTRLSKYHQTSAAESHPIFVVDGYDPLEKPVPIEQVTQVFQKYEETRLIERLYVSPDQLVRAKSLLMDSGI